MVNLGMGTRNGGNLWNVNKLYPVIIVSPLLLLMIPLHHQPSSPNSLSLSPIRREEVSKRQQLNMIN